MVLKWALDTRDNLGVNANEHMKKLTKFFENHFTKIQWDVAALAKQTVFL